MKTKDSIITLPHTNLRQRSKKVGFIDESVRKLVADMEAATLDWEDSREHEVGVALAAVQIDVLMRVVVVRKNHNDKTDRNFITLINPEITKFEGEIAQEAEGCLSIKEIYGKVPRHNKVKVKALDVNGRPVRITAEGFLARIMQHEIDHTNGKMFIDHIKDEKDAFFRLSASGDLEQLDYDKEIKNNKDLWS